MDLSDNGNSVLTIFTLRNYFYWQQCSIADSKRIRRGRGDAPVNPRNLSVYVKPLRFCTKRFCQKRNQTPPATIIFTVLWHRLKGRPFIKPRTSRLVHSNVGYVVLTASSAGSCFVKGVQVESLIFALKIEEFPRSQFHISPSISLKPCYS